MRENDRAFLDARRAKADRIQRIKNFGEDAWKGVLAVTVPLAASLVLLISAGLFVGGRGQIGECQWSIGSDPSVVARQGVIEGGALFHMTCEPAVIIRELIQTMPISGHTV